jgi:hypothetical protein
MSFTRVRAPGAWTDGSVLGDAELEKFDDQISNAIDGRHGGAYAPDNEIEIGGAGFRCTAIGYFDAGVQASADSVFLNVEVLENADFEGEVNFNDDSFFHKPVTFNDDVEFNDPVVWNDTATFNAGLHVAEGGDAVVDSQLSVAGLATLGSLLCGPAILGVVQLNDKLQLAGSGRIQKRVTNATNADATYNISTTDIVTQPSGVVLSVDRTWTIGTTGAEAGMTMILSRFAANDDGKLVSVVDQASASLIGTLRPTAGFFAWIEIVFDGIRWQRVGGAPFS